MRLNFSKKEMTQFLEKRGFTVTTVPTKVTIAYKNDLSKKELSKESRYLKDTYGLDTVFNREFKKALLWSI